MIKKIFLLIITCIIISPVFADELTDDYFDIARNYNAVGNYTKALEYINYVLMLNPKYNKAIEFRDKILPQESNDDLTETALLLAKQNSVDGLIILDIPKNKQTVPDNTSDYYNKQGKKFYQNKEYDAAIQCFFKAIAVDDKNYQAYNNLAMTYWMKNNIEFAEKYFNKAASLNKTYPQPFINLALLNKQLGNNNKYYEYLNKALKVNPNNYWTHYLLGDYYSTLEKYPDSIDYYIDSIKINPNFAPPYLALAVAYFKTDKYEYSIIALERYLAIIDSSDFAYSMLAKNYQLLDNLTEAKKAIKKALELNPTNVYRVELAKIEFNAKNYREALINFQILLPDYDYAEVYNYIGLCYHMLKNYDPAVAYFNKAIVSDGHRPIYFYNLAQCYMEIGDKRRYVQYMNTALQINPLTYQDYIDLSCIYYNTSKNNLAINSLKLGIENYPNSKPLYLALLNLYARIGDKTNYNIIKNEIEMRFNTNEQKKKKQLFK